MVGTLAGGGPAVVLEVRAGFAFVALATGAVEVPDQAVTRRLVLAGAGLTRVRGGPAWHLEGDPGGGSIS